MTSYQKIIVPTDMIASHLLEPDPLRWLKFMVNLTFHRRYRSCNLTHNCDSLTPLLQSVHYPLHCFPLAIRLTSVYNDFPLHGQGFT